MYIYERENKVICVKKFKMEEKLFVLLNKVYSSGISSKPIYIVVNSYEYDLFVPGQTYIYNINIENLERS